jgi:glycerol kinase
VPSLGLAGTRLSVGCAAVGLVLGIDAGTTGVRTVGVDERGQVRVVAYRELTQSYPAPGLVEHDPLEIAAEVLDTLAEVARWAKAHGESVAAVGVTNQRETVVAFDRRTGAPLAPAIVWQDRRTAGRCRTLAERGLLPLVRERTGLVLDPYFSATKMAWLLEEGGVAPRSDLVLGTVDTWVLYVLTGGADGGIVATDPTNASRTLLYDLRARGWSEDLCERFGVPIRALAEVRPSCGVVSKLGTEAQAACDGVLRGVPVAGVAGDQQAAMFGQACYEPGDAKATYGTGTFVLAHAGFEPPEPPPGLLVTVAWDLGAHGPPERAFAYALEGSVFATGAAVQWLRDGLGAIEDAAHADALASSVPSSDGVVVVPAFAGLGSPWWDPTARGAVVGITKGTTRAHLARAVLESIACQVRDVLEAARGAGLDLRRLAVDGGASASELLLRLQADQLGVPVVRSATREATALGAAMLAGLAVGVWASTDELAACWRADLEVGPSEERAAADATYERWSAAIERARRWAREDGASDGT